MLYGKYQLWRIRRDGSLGHFLITGLLFQLFLNSRYVRQLLAAQLFQSSTTASSIRAQLMFLTFQSAVFLATVIMPERVRRNLL